MRLLLVLFEWRFTQVVIFDKGLNKPTNKVVLFEPAIKDCSGIVYSIYVRRSYQIGHN